MAWVQVGAHKINTALICYVEQEDDTVRLYFTGEWEGNPLDLHFDEAKAFWRHVKAEDVMMVRDKGSATVLPRLKSAVSVDAHPNRHNEDRPKPHSSSSSGHHQSHSAQQHPRHVEPLKSHSHGEHKKH